MKNDERKPIVDFCRELLRNPEPYTLSEQMQAMIIVQLESILHSVRETDRLVFDQANIARDMAQNWADFLRYHQR